MKQHNILITGASGYLGSQLLKHLYALQQPEGAKKKASFKVVATDVRKKPEAEQLDGIIYDTLDVRTPKVEQLLKKHKIKTVVHLAAIVVPPKRRDIAFEHSVDVDGTRNVLDACLATGVKRFIITSSGAAYGYHADNPEWLTEDDALRGNDIFPYSRHKRLVEEMLAEYREKHPKLEQTIFRVGTILGGNTRNQITDLFDKAVTLGIRGSRSPFVFIWDQDAVACLTQAILGKKSGIYNLAGDGCLTPKELAREMKKPYVELPANLIRKGIGVFKKIGLTQYTPDQVLFMQHRPVLDNRKLKEEFEFIPQKTSLETFRYYWRHRK